MDVADAGATVTILDGITAVGSAVVQANGTWTATGVTLSNGSNSLTARVTDAAGNIGTSNAVIYTLSTTGPTVTEALASTPAVPPATTSPPTMRSAGPGLPTRW